ncbi:AMP-binding protein, partial [Streptomyces rubiginosohelvolus]|uniref:AMP-binding protein n=1 Tax=Streptomyces rubiginosohelvolus TaxID=67362 RepID=UPI0034081764
MQEVCLNARARESGGPAARTRRRTRGPARGRVHRRSGRPGGLRGDHLRELDETARRVAVLLRRAGVAEGDRVLLLHPPGLGFPRGFTGCLYAGAIAVPAPMPDGYRRQRERLAGIARDARVSA